MAGDNLHLKHKKRHDEAAVRSLYEVAFEEADTAIFLSDGSGRCFAVNRRALLLTGYAREELLGKDILDLFESFEPDSQPSRAAFGFGDTVITEGTLRNRNESLLTVELHIKKLSDGNFLEIARDITAQKRAEETLRKNEELFRIAFDHAPTGMSIIAPDGFTFLAVNPLLCEMFGYTREEFLGNTIRLVTHPDDEERSNEWIRKKFNNEPCEPFIEKRYIHKDGHIVWGLVWAHWIKNDDGTNRMAIGHIQDITEQKMAEEERRKLQIQLGYAMELAHLAYWEYDVLTDLFTFNDQFYRIFRTTAEKMGGYTMSSAEYASRFIPVHERHLVAEEVRKALETTDPNFTQRLEHGIVYDDGSTGTISVNHFVEKDESGRTVKTFGINQDITERIRAEEERARLEDQVRHAQKMESIGLLAGGVAHDFNNLLTPILGYADILSLGLEGDEPRQKQLQQIRKAAQRAKEVAQQLLAFSRKQLLELKTVKLGDIVNTFENILRRTIRENIEIQIRITPEPCLVKADPGQIEQVLLNLSINAQDAMPAGGLMVIEVNTIDLYDSVVSGYQEISPGPYVVLSVQDNGVGIEDEVIKQIFEPFYTTKEVGKGTGLGLSTAYGIVRQHGGSLFVRSHVGRGSVFEVFLPRIDDEGEKGGVEATIHTDEISHGHETVLVVEDNEMVRSLTCDMLDQLGYRVLVEKDPECCSELVAGHRGHIDLLLTDVIMPKMNGRQLFDALRKLQPDLKVVFMSGYASNLFERQSIIDQDTHFLQKPFSLSKLSEILRLALDADQGRPLA